MEMFEETNGSIDCNSADVIPENVNTSFYKLIVYVVFLRIG